MSNVQPFYSPKFRAFDANGDPLNGGLLYTYTANSSTPQSTYTTRAGNVANANPVVLDANGEADVWCTPNVSYKFVLKDSAGVTQWTVDNVPSSPDLSLVPLLMGDGTVAAPSIAFSADPDNGLYRAGANNPAMSAGGAQAQNWTNTGSTLPLGVTVTQSQTNTAALTATGNGSATGVHGVGGASGDGVTGTGTGVGSGVVGAGGTTSGTGGVFSGGTPNGPGVSATGVGNGVGIAAAGGAGHAGGTFANGTAALAGTRQDALAVTNGDISLDGVATVTKTVAIKNRLTPKNIIKAWARVSTDGLGAISLIDGFNVASVALSTSTVGQLNFAQAMADGNYCAVATATHSSASGRIVSVQGHTTAKVNWLIVTDAGAAFDISANASEINIIVVGFQ